MGVHSEGNKSQTLSQKQKQKQKQPTGGNGAEMKLQKDKISQDVLDAQKSKTRHRILADKTLL